MHGGYPIARSAKRRLKLFQQGLHCCYARGISIYTQSCKRVSGLISEHSHGVAQVVSIDDCRLVRNDGRLVTAA
jgi:hypothetical protein